jgi:hypothetical protein
LGGGVARDLEVVGDHDRDRLPAVGDAGFCRTASSPSGTSARLGAFSWVMTLRRPSSAGAWTAVISPLATVDCTITA